MPDLSCRELVLSQLFYSPQRIVKREIAAVRSGKVNAIQKL
jgi:hypothetical protein